MKLEEFNARLIESISLAASAEEPFDSTLFLYQQQEEIQQIAGIADFKVIHIELPQENIMCDGYALDENSGKLDVILADVSKNGEYVEEIFDEEVQAIFEKGLSFVNHILQNKLRNLIDESEEEQHSAVDEIYESALRLEQITFCLITNKTFYSETDFVTEDKINDISYSSLVISLLDFFEFWQSRSSEPISPYIDFQKLGYKLPFIKLSADYYDYSGYLVVMNGRALFDIYDEHETDLLQGNVRFFLNATRKQNKGLLETLENDRQKFFAYNNGISATANAIEFFEEDGQEYIKTVDNLQIVNGGQTTATIHFFGEKNEASLKLLDSVYLQMKLNVITNKENEKTFVHDISRYANTQSAVTFSDLDANDHFNIEIEKHSRTIGIPDTNGEKWFYERKTGDHFTTGLNLGKRDPSALTRFRNEFIKDRVIKKTELAIRLFSWGFKNSENLIEPRPYDAGLGAEKNYDKFKKYRANNRIHTDAEFYKDSISKVILARKLTDIVNEAGIKQQRNHVVNYTMASLSLLCNGELNFKYIWEKQDISPELSKSLLTLVKKIWEKIEDSAGLINIGTWCRKPECWLEVKDIKHHFSSNIPEILIDYSTVDDEPGEKRKTETASEKSEPGTKQLSFAESLEDSGFWFRLAKWAKENNVLDGRSRKFSFQVGTLISRKIDLSPKQNKWALTCYNTACSTGYNQPTEGNEILKYYKMICNQDIERTPSISVEAVKEFFKLDLKNGESCDVDIFIGDSKVPVELNKRNTRNEYRFFLNRIREHVGYDVEDILEFTKNETGYYIKVIKTTNSEYDSLIEKMKGKLHFIGEIN